MTQFQHYFFLAVFPNLKWIDCEHPQPRLRGEHLAPVLPAGRGVPHGGDSGAGHQEGGGDHTQLRRAAGAAAGQAGGEHEKQNTVIMWLNF